MSAERRGSEMKVLSKLFTSTLIITTVLTILSPSSGLAATGDKDSGFGGFGTNGSISVAGMSTREMALLPDGKILVVGSNGPNLVIRRFKANGDTDLPFGNNGKVSIDLGSEDACGNWRQPFSCGVATHADGRFAVLARYSVISAYDFAILSFLPDGDLDASFGIGGLAIVDFDGDLDQPNGIAIQPDGKVVVVGSVHYGIDERFGIARLNTDGKLDTGFSGDGKVNISFDEDFFGENQIHEAYALAIQNDGKIVVAGRAYDVKTFGKNDFEFGVARLNTDGSLDTSFAGDGRKRIGFGGDEAAYDVKITSEGKIVLVGGAYSDSRDDLGTQFAVARLNSDGSLDNSFGGDGTLLYNQDADVEETLFAVALQADGKVVAAGHVDTNLQMMRLSVGGLRDSSFSGNGIRDFGALGLARDLIIQPDGNFLLLYGDAILRVSPDTTLDSAGNTVTNFGSGDDRAWGIDIQRDGKVLVVGESTEPSQDLTIARYLTNGQLDTAFGQFGMVRISNPDGDGSGRSVATQKDGKILVAGFDKSTLDGKFRFHLARLSTSGARDVTFGQYGKFADFGAGDAYGVKVLVQQDGKIILVGFAENGTGADPDRMGIAVVRYLPSGDLDTSFSGDGKVVTIVGPGSTARARNAILQSDGKILVSGVYERNMLVMRYYTNGTLDTSFGSNGFVLANKLGNEVGYGLGFVYGGHIAIGGIVDSGDFGVLILDPNGKRCTACSLFAGDHYWRIVDFGYNESAFGFAVQDNGKMVLTGGESSGNSGVFATRIRRLPSFRHPPAFDIDNSFGSSGKIIHTSLFRSSARTSALFGTGIYIAGFRFNGHDDDFFLMRLENDSTTWPGGNPFENLIFGDGFEE